MGKHYFYVVKCCDNSFYAGYTNNLEKRISCHNDGKGAKYTRARRPVMLIHHQQFDEKRRAMQYEYYFKKLSRKQKECYLAGAYSLISERIEDKQ